MLLVRLPWLAPRSYLDEELAAGSHELLDLDAGFRRYISSESRLRRELEDATATMDALDRRARLSGARLQTFYDAVRMTAVLRMLHDSSASGSRAALVDEYVQRLLGSACWYYGPTELAPRFGVAPVTIADPRQWGRMPVLFDEYLGSIEWPRPGTRARAILVEPGQLPYALLLARRLRARRVVLEIELRLFAGADADIVDAFEGRLVAAGARLRRRRPAAPDRLPDRSPPSRSRRGSGALTRVSVAPPISRAAPARDIRVPRWLANAAGRHIHLDVHIVLGARDDEEQLFRVMDMVLALWGTLGLITIRAHVADRGSTTATERIRMEANVTDMLRVQVAAEAGGAVPRLAPFAGRRLGATAVTTIASRYPLHDLARHDLQADAASSRFGTSSPLPPTWIARPSARRRPYQFFAGSPTVFGPEDAALAELVRRCSQPRGAETLVRGLVRRGFEEADVVEGLSSLVHARILEYVR